MELKRFNETLEEELEEKNKVSEMILNYWSFSMGQNDGFCIGIFVKPLMFCIIIIELYLIIVDNKGTATETGRHEEGTDE